MCQVSVSHMAVQDDISGHLQLVLLRTDLLGTMPVPVMLASTLPSHHLWVQTISVNQESILGQVQDFIQMILSGTEKVAVRAVAVAHSTILHTLLRHCPAPPLTQWAIEARLCRLDNADDSPVEFMELYVK